MDSPHFLVGRETELRAMIRQPDREELDHWPHRAVCRGMNPEDFHPDEGAPKAWVLAQCNGCEARLACLALALRAEKPDARSGWYGGLGPEDRDDVAANLGLEIPAPPASDRAVQAARLQADGWTVQAIATELGCSRRTAQRDLHTAA